MEAGPTKYPNKLIYTTRKKIPAGIIYRKIPKLLSSILDGSQNSQTCLSSKLVKVEYQEPARAKETRDQRSIDNGMCTFFNSFTTCLQSKVLQAVQHLHLPKASVYIEHVSDTRPIVGQLEALCFFIGLASTQLNSKSVPVHSQIYNKLRPKFLAFTNALVAFQTTRKEIDNCIWKKVDSVLRAMESENKEKLEQLYGEDVPGLEELQSLCPTPPPNIAAAIWEEGAAGEHGHFNVSFKNFSI